MENRYTAPQLWFSISCAISSAVERYLHTVDVIGSIPISHIDLAGTMRSGLFFNDAGNMNVDKRTVLAAASCPIRSAFRKMSWQ